MTKLLLVIIVRRNGLRSTMMTSNRPIQEWEKQLGVLPAAGTILDRLLHHAEILTIKGRSHRLAQRAGEKAVPTASPPPEKPPHTPKPTLA